MIDESYGLPIDKKLNHRLSSTKSKYKALP
jgi:hypothetical protein